MQFDKFLLPLCQVYSKLFLYSQHLRMRIFQCGVAKASQSVYVNMQQVRSGDTPSQEKFPNLYASKITSQAVFGCFFLFQYYLPCLWSRTLSCYTFTRSGHTHASAHPPILTVLWFFEVLHVTAHHAKSCVVNPKVST